jgi:lipopolysaccharide export system protein LptA
LNIHRAVSFAMSRPCLNRAQRSIAAPRRLAEMGQRANMKTKVSSVAANADRARFEWHRQRLVMTAAACVLNLGEHRVKVK